MLTGVLYMITIIAEFDVKDSNIAEFIKYATDVTRETRKEKGCLSYKVLNSRKNKTHFTFIEEWLNDVAIEAHGKTRHFNAFIENITPILNGEIKIEQFEKIPSVFF